MAYPPYVLTRPVSVGGSMTLEGSEALRIRVTVTSTRSLVWDDTGYRFESRPVSVTSEPGTEASLVLPRTDVAGWRDGRTGALIDVSAPDSHSHTYNALVEFLTTAGTSAGITPVHIGPFVLPAGDGTIDLDKTVPVGTVSGQVLSVPDSWSLLVASAEQAAQEAAATLATFGTPVVAAAPSSIAKRGATGTLKTAPAVAPDDAVPLASVVPLVAAAVAADGTVAAAATAAVGAATAELDLLDAQQVQGAAAWNPEGAYPKGSVVAQGGALWQARPGAEVTTVRTNYVPDPLFLGTGTWTITGGSITSVVDGVATITCTTTRTAGNTVVGLGTPTVAAGTGPWAMSLRVGIPLDGVAVTLLVSAGFGPSPLSSPATTSVSLTPGEEVTVTQVGNVVGATGKTTVAVRIQAGPGGFPAGAKATISQPVLEQGTVVGEFFHGGTPDVDTPALDATYEWLGTPNASASRETRTPHGATGLPGVSSDWLRLWSLPDVRPVPALAASRVPAALADIPRWMDRTRTKVWGRSGGDLRQSTDDGATWTTIHTWSGANLGGAIREFENGELLVVTTPVTTDAPSEVWVSSGYPTLGAGATWTKVIQPTVPNIRFTDAWSVYVHGSIGLVAEYGPKEGTTGGAAGSGQFARLVHLTLDNGKTWAQILDLADLASGTNVGLHLHGVAWDPYWDRIWLTWGDDQNGTAYSDDLGATWHHAHYESSVNGPYQNVGILPMKDCILFGSDIGPNGIYRINRSEGKRTGTYPIELAHAINADSQRNALCQGIFQASPDHPAFFAFGSETRPMASQIVATRDGYDFYKVWEDAVMQPAGRGLRSVIGPTLRGRLFAEFNDPDDGGTSVIAGPAPY